MKTVIIASGNEGKIREFKSIFATHGISVEGINKYLPGFDVDETGETFEENAVLKAEAASYIMNLPVISDDSGLEVDELNGAPGIYSARYADGLGDKANNEKLLSELEGVEDRSARFVCAIAVAIPNHETKTFIGTVEGNILHSETGTNGFGYDPLFETTDGYQFGMIDSDVKNTMSHRSRALTQLMNNTETIERLKEMT